MDIFKPLILFDENRPAPSGLDIMIWTCVILIASNLIFVILCAGIGINSNKDLGTEKDKEYVQWKARGLSPWTLALSELMNSTIYSPVAEELAFRLFLMKYVCIKSLKMPVPAANVVQATVFGLMHMSNNVYTSQSSKYTNLQSLSAGISGLVSGWVYQHCNSLLPSLAAHMINNAAAGSSEVWGYIQYRKKA